MSAQITAETLITAIEGSAGNVSTVARKLGVTRQTVYNHISKYKTVQDALQDARESLKDYAEGKLLEQIRKDNLTAIIFYLKTQGKDRGYTERFEFTGRIDVTIVSKLVSALEASGLDPAEVFNTMIAELAHADAD